ncbi:MAG: class II aldolase [Deltaproteobacteria bacterium HGW-Deltaproteobacteria-6]|nr:MAG: class II aldolase [Deltaproteobacteria bacterium HGW-Deltaproteobacteria-6]
MMTGKYIGYKKDVLNACLWLSQQGYLGSLKGSTGNVSVRIDGETSMAITPTGVKYQDMSDDDICVVGFDLAMIEWKSGRKPSMEAGLHSVIYRTRPDVNAIVHTHQTYGSVFAVINTPIPALFDEVALSLGQVTEIVPYAFSGSPELAGNIESRLSNNANAYIIQNHGVVALGGTLDQAMLNAELLEKNAHVYWMALSSGKPVTLLPESTIERIGAMRKAEK